MKKHFGFLVLILLLTGNLSIAQDLEQIESFAGYWKFSIGDNPKWMQENYDDSDWDRIKVPASWESQGYDDYNGYAWYRKTFEWDSFDEIESPIYLCLGGVDDVDEVFLNGKFLGKTGDFPPNLNPSWPGQRAYLIPKDRLKSKGINTIAVRVYDYIGGGGIRNGKIGIYSDRDYRYIDVPLHGKWKFKEGKDRNWAKTKFQDQKWAKINVPDTWENQGYQELDGDACYRKTFTLDDKPDDDLFLILGRVDDYDRVYINGVFVASYKDLEDSYTHIENDNMWRVMRIYSIPDDLLYEGRNQITVYVKDPQGLGGIYSGPIGITSEYNSIKIKKKYQPARNAFEILFRSFFD